MSDLQICQILGNGGFLERVKTLPDEFIALAKATLKDKLALESYDDLNELKVLCALFEREAIDFEEMRVILADLKLRNKSLSEEARMNILLVLQIMAEEKEIWDEVPKLALRKWLNFKLRKIGEAKLLLKTFVNFICLLSEKTNKIDESFDTICVAYILNFQ